MDRKSQQGSYDDDIKYKSLNTSQACPVPVGNAICGETNSLEIMKEFNKMYEDRMERMDSEAGGDCLQEKIKLQQEWIRNLTQQNEMLVKAVQELEYEATERVQQLEEKLQKSAQCLCEVMKKYREHDFVGDLLGEHLQKINHLENDLENVLEFVRRVRENHNWSLDGLVFYVIDKRQLIGGDLFKKSTFDDANEGEKMLQDKDRTLLELTERIQSYGSVGDVEGMAQELEMRTKECDSLKKEMADMRHALTEEVATKHDETVALKKELQLLEERCVHADKQTAFKEDIIKELRKEIKQLKLQVTEKYLSLVAGQLAVYFEKHNKNNNYKNSAKLTSEDDIRTNENLTELKQCIKIKDELLVEQLNLIKVLVTRLFVIDQKLKFLEERTLSVTSCIADKERKDLEEKIRKLENENSTLKETLLLDKNHIEHLDRQFKCFLQERDELKKRNKTLDKLVKSSFKEKDAMLCKCEQLKKEISQLKEKNKQLQNEIQRTKSQLDSLNNESISYREKMQKVAEENRKAIEQITTLNKENENLSHNIDVLRQRSEYTVNFTNDEITKMNATIGELRETLDKTRIAQEEEEKIHEEEIGSLNETIGGLEQQLEHLKKKYEKDLKTCKICRGKSKVGFLESSEIQVDLGNTEKDSELVQVINDTKTKMTIEIEKRNNEIEQLKNKISELTSALNSCEERAANLQEAIDNQKVTIANLQQALVDSKNEIDVLRKKSQDNESTKQIMERVIADVEDESDFFRKMAENVYRNYETLQDLNFTLEVEHCDSLQDVDSLEYQLNKLKILLNLKKEQLNKLAKQKKCYEEVISYFKREMSMMADQLSSLQELLTLSNETAHQESTKIMEAFNQVQTLNEQLSSQLCACEQKVQLESQMNQLHDTKINELQQLVNEKEVDLMKHNQTIANIRKTLNDSLKTNEDLQGTVKMLNDTIAELQCAVKQYERENCASKKSCQEFQNQIGGYYDKLQNLKQNLDDKTAECLKLEMAHNNEKRQLKMVQKQLQDKEKLVEESQNELLNSLEDYKQKLTFSDETNARLMEELEQMQSQLANLTRKEAVKDLEIKRYRKIVGDLKSTMMELNMELNKNLAQKELKGCKNANCRKKLVLDKDDPKYQDICMSCPCEVEFYQKMVDTLKKSVTDLKSQLNDTQQKNKSLEDALKQKDAEIVDLKQTKDELNRKLVEMQLNHKKMTEMEREIDSLSQELQVRSIQLTDVKKSANEINSSKCVQLSCAQEEISNLKNELSNCLNKQYALKKENEELHNELAQLNCNMCCLNDKIKMFKEQAEQNLFRIKSLSVEKEAILRKNKELLQELRSMQSVEKQQRLTIDSLKQLESDIEELKSNKEEICSESKNVIKNVRAWVEEQKRINSFVAKREQDRHKQKIQVAVPVPSQNRVQPHSPECRSKCIKRAQVGCPVRRAHFNTSPFSLGSQGNVSFNDVSPPSSPDFQLNNEWYSTNFRTESDPESEDDYCVSTLEHLTQQMRKSNRIWIQQNNSSQKNCNGAIKDNINHGERK